MATYIHYGSDQFDPEKFQKIENIPVFSKPKGGLWASPIDSEYSWKKWCEANDFHLELLEKSFIFRLKEDSRLLFIDDVKQLDDLPKTKPPAIFSNFDIWDHLDFEELAQWYDAIEITLSKEKSKNICKYTEGLYSRLYGWDCDSICILNPKCVEILENQ